MMKHSGAAKQYLREIKRTLPCPGRMKRRIYQEICATTDAYIDGHPGATYENLVSRFGAPQEIALTYVNESDSEELIHNLQIRRKIVRIVAISAVAVTILWVGMMAMAFLDAKNQSHGRSVDRVEVSQIISKKRDNDEKIC